VCVGGRKTAQKSMRRRIAIKKKKTLFNLHSTSWGKQAEARIRQKRKKGLNLGVTRGGNCPAWEKKKGRRKGRAEQERGNCEFTNCKNVCTLT